MTMASNSLESARLQQQAEALRPTQPRDWYLLVVLTLLLIMSFVDRAALVLLVAPVRSDLGLTDGQISLLLGASFAVFYVVMGLPAGYLVDRFNRRGLLLGGAIIWTSMTFASAFAPSFAWLFFCRTGVGLGEAILSPAAYSMIRDVFPPRRRPLAFGFHNAGAPLGNGASLLVISVFTAAAMSGAFDGLLSNTGSNHWRLVLALTGLVNVPFVLLLLTIREPVRQEAPGAQQSAAVAAVVQWMRERLPVYAGVFGATACFGVGYHGFTSWLPTALARAWNVQATSIGPTLGSLQIVMAPLGLLAAGVIVTAASTRGKHHLAGWLGGSALLLAALLLMLLPFVTAQSGNPLAWIVVGALYFLFPWCGVVCATVLAYATPGRMMGKATAVNFLMLSLVGMAFGPTLVSLIADRVFTGNSALVHALGSGSAIATAGAGLLLWLVARGLNAMNAKELQP